MGKFTARGITAPESSRARAEAEMSKNLKNMLNNKIPNVFNLSTFITDWFHVNKKETTYSEGTKQSTDIRSYRFDLIEGFPAHNVPERKEVDDDKEDRKVNIRTNPDGVLYIAASYMQPVEMDHFFAYNFADMENHLFVVTDVKRTFLIDRDWWEVKYTPSPYLKYDDIMDLVINTYVYKESDMTSPNGESGSTIVTKGNAAAQDGIAAAIETLNSNFIETFYSEKYDALGFFPKIDVSRLEPTYLNGLDLIDKPEWIELFRRRKMGFIYYALMDLQARAAVMTYGLDRNILFLEPPYVLDGAKASYNGSLFDKLIERKFNKKGVITPDDSPFKHRTAIEDETIANPSAYALKYYEVIRDNLNRPYELKDYEPQYDYSIMFNFKMYETHTALSRFWNSGIALNYLLHHTYFNDTYEKTGYVKYTLKQNIVTKFCDMFMNKDYEGIQKNLYLLGYYTLDKDNIDDYIGVPMLMIVLIQTLKEIQQGANMTDKIKGNG